MQTFSGDNINSERFSLLKRVRNYNKQYKIDFKVSLIISLILVIALFVFFPYIKPPEPVAPEYQTLLFTISNIAPTSTQERPANPPPVRPHIYVPDLDDEPVILPDIDIVSSSNSNKSGTKGNSSGNSQNGIVMEIPHLNFIPRQILEVLPKNVDKDTKGYVNLQLKIGTDGKVISYKVLANTTGSKETLESVIAAAFKSKWEPVKIDNNKIVYWVEKTYNFN